MKTQLIFLRIAGIISLIFMLIRFFYYKMFDWENDLNCLMVFNRAVLLTYFYISFFIFGLMAFISIIQPKSLLNSPLKYSILSTFALIYLTGIIAEFTLFGYSIPLSPVIIFLCTISIVFYTVPLFYKSRIS